MVFSGLQPLAVEGDQTLHPSCCLCQWIRLNPRQSPPISLPPVDVATSSTPMAASILIGGRRGLHTLHTFSLPDGSATIESSRHEERMGGLGASPTPPSFLAPLVSSLPSAFRLRQGPGAPPARARRWTSWWMRARWAAARRPGARWRVEVHADGRVGLLQGRSGRRMEAMGRAEARWFFFGCFSSDVELLDISVPLWPPIQLYVNGNTTMTGRDRGQKPKTPVTGNLFRLEKKETKEI
jgi:hypothetical protein